MLTVKIHNVETGEVIEREMNTDEIARLKADEAEIKAKNEDLAAVALAKTALLKKLGITEEEAKLLLS